MNDPRKVLARRLNGAGLLDDRLIPVQDGAKASLVGHQQRQNRYSNFAGIDGNYGVYAGATPDGDKWLVDVDIDDYAASDVTTGALEAVLELPETLTVETPHTDGERGGHRYYAVACDNLPAKIEALAGATNPKPPWGELRVQNQYVVGPGSQLDGCDKEWCDDCATAEGGRYKIANDAPIAEIEPDELLDVLRASGYDGDDDADDENDGESTDVTDYEPKEGDTNRAEKVAQHDDKTRRYLAFGAKSAGFRSDDGSGDRSRADCYVCCRMLEYGVPEEQARDLLESNNNTKVYERGRDYWRSTWNDAQGRADANSKTLPGDDDGKTSDGEKPTWKTVRNLYATADDTEKTGRARFTAAEVLLHKHSWRNLEENDQLYWYDPSNGVYLENGEAKARALAGDGLDHHYAKREVREYLSHLRAKTTIPQAEMGGPENMVAVQNGVLDLETMELVDPSPEYNFMSRLQTKYDPDAECPRWRRCLDDWVTRDLDKKKLQEYAGYTLMHWSAKHHKALFVVGPEASGKSTFADTIKSLHGEDTVANLTPQQMTSRFGGAELYGTWVNISNEVPTDTVEDTGTFKQIVAADGIKAERKHKDPFMFHPTAKHIFAANQLPDTQNDDAAFYRRILLVAFPHTVPRNDRDLNLDEKLRTELPGILNWALEGLERLEEQGGFTGDLDVHQTAQEWDKWGHTVDRFAQACIETTNETEPKPKGDVYRVYQAFCEAESMPCEMQSAMTRRLKTEHAVSDGHATVDGTQERCFLNLAYTSKGEHYRELADSDDDRDDTDPTGLDGFD